MTRSLSNVIKAYSVRYDEVVKKTIDSQLKINNIIEVKPNVIPQSEESASEFVEGIDALVVDAFSSEEDASEKASEILEQANDEAEMIIEQAKQEAERIKSDAFSMAKASGYEEGKQQAKQEGQRLQYEYDVKAKQLQSHYEELLKSAEPEVVKLVSSLVQKITGIVVEDKEEVILYLVQNSIKNMERSNEYTIRISKDDFEYVAERKDIILEALGREVSIYFTEDLNLLKNQCLIETDMQVINCSLDIQLNNLITDLKLLGSI